MKSNPQSIKGTRIVNSMNRLDLRRQSTIGSFVWWQLTKGLSSDDIRWCTVRMVRGLFNSTTRLGYAPNHPLLKSFWLFQKITHGSSRDGYLYSYYEVIINKGCYTPMYILYPYALDHPKSKSIPFLKIRYVATFL